MPTLREGDLLWQPSAETLAAANLTHYLDWLARERGLTFADYDALWRWSVTDLPAFWQSIWDYGGVVASAPAQTVLAWREMPGAVWFPGAQLNYAENLFAQRSDQPAILYQAEDAPLIAIDWETLATQTAALAATLRRLGVRAGDRVAAYLPNIPQAIVALLATASLGAIWSSCSPDFGSRSVLDRFQQIEPKVLLVVDGYRYGGKPFDRRDTVAELQAGLPTLVQTIWLPLLDARSADNLPAQTLSWQAAIDAGAGAALTFAQLPFDHPLWILYSSGTTGRPKPIVHGHGGILLEHLKMARLHLDLHPGDRFFWYTSTGWMMWNFLIGGLLAGASIVIYNGAPGYPDMHALWRLAAAAGITYFGTSAAFVNACIKAEIHPNQQFELGAIRAVGSTGSPLGIDGFAWVYANVNPTLALESVSGGTDVCTAFVGGCRLRPIYAGEIQGPTLGAHVQAFDDDGNPVIDTVGELVLTAPLPSMPIQFWNDPTGERYLASYFDIYPGVWRHGDWIKFTPRGGCIIYGRSDSTINRHGIRMGTSEIYQVVEGFDEVLDSLIVDLELLGRASYLPLFVVLRPGATLDDDLRARIRAALRRDISPRHVPDSIEAVDEIPYTLSGKKLEVPIRRILLGQPVEKVANPGALRNPGAIDYFVRLARQLNS